jgi:hypothetical protein
MKRALAILLVIMFSGFGCYTFKDISIKPDVKSFNVEEFSLRANAPGSINQTFTEALKQKIQSDTRLFLDESNPNIIFEGTITSFSVVSTATDSQNTASLNKLEIRIKINYTNVLHEDENWESTFSDYANFDRDVNLSDVQDGLIEEIYEQIIDAVINKAFSNW